MAAELAPLLIVVMFGVGTDYIVFMLFRYREQMGEGAGPAREPDGCPVPRGEVIVSAAVTVMLAFAALLVASIGQLRSLAPGLIIGVGLMLLAALTLVPAVLSLFGARCSGPDTEAARPAHRTRSSAWAPPCPSVLASCRWPVSSSWWSWPPASSTSRSPTTSWQSCPGQSSTEAYNSISTAFPAGFLGPSEAFVTSSARSTRRRRRARHQARPHGGRGTGPPVQYAAGRTRP